jgi:imidazole glycerol-phosphate synthase
MIGVSQPKISERNTFSTNVLQGPLDLSSITMSTESKEVWMLDTFGNVHSLINACNQLGFKVNRITDPSQIPQAKVSPPNSLIQKIMFCGVGNFGHCMNALQNRQVISALRDYILAGKPFMGICVGLQALFSGSEESPSIPGLGILPGKVERFSSKDKAVPHIGWNNAAFRDSEDSQSEIYGLRGSSKYYYVHSYAAPFSAENTRLLDSWHVATGRYGDEEFIGAIAHRQYRQLATQFHPEKSGKAGLRVLKAFLEDLPLEEEISVEEAKVVESAMGGLTRRVIACLDVRTNDAGDLVVTKGDQYDVREKTDGNQVRNLGKPVELAQRYYEEGADEITFLNITSFRNYPLVDLPMLEILRRTAERVFVPLTIGGGIRDLVDPDGTRHSALDVTTMYFQSGADKVSIGSDAVLAVEEYLARGKKLDGTTSIETIAAAYGNQAVVVSVDPRRVYVNSPSDTTHHAIKVSRPGPNGEQYAWYQCTIKGGREGRDLDVRQLVMGVEQMGAGEILLNCMDQDGTNEGYDLELIKDVKEAVKIPVIASSGAGKVEHFYEAFVEAGADAALAAGIFHRREGIRVLLLCLF